jgi:phosphohistidine phosphatase
MADTYSLYLIRHAIAEERGEAWSDDTKRPLSSVGIARMRKSAVGLARLCEIDVVLTSPLVRAKQTAEIVANAFTPRLPMVIAESLAPGGTYRAVLEDLEKQSRRSSIALVGHEPGIGELAARLIGSRHPLQFKKGAVCRVDVETLPPAGSGALAWFVTPGILRKVRS